MSYKDQIQIAEQLLAKIEMPVLPKEVLDLQHIFNNNDMPDPKKIKQLISNNPLLAGELIGIANLLMPSSLNAQKIKDIDNAIYRLGYKQIKNYVVSIYIKELLDNHKIQGLSYHSQSIAIIATIIARYNHYIKPDEAYLLGLIHDIGSFALSAVDQSYGATFVGKLVDHYASEKNEYHQYGTTHAALGYVIARIWHIPNHIAQTILLHHEQNIESIENDKLRYLVALIELAHALVNERNHKLHHSHDNETLYHRSQHVLGLSDQDMTKIRIELDG